MKFTKTNRLFIAVILIYLTIFVELSQIESSIKFGLNSKRNHKYAVQRSKSRSVSRNRTHQNIRTGCVLLFKDCNYQGESVQICGDLSEYSSSWRGELSSVIVGPDTKLILFSDTEFGGDSFEVIGRNSCLGNFNDRTRSHMILVKNNAVLFEHCNYKGSALKITDSESNLGDVWKNDEASSVIVGPETKITIFEHADFKGQALEISNNIPCLGSLGWNDKASSAQILANVKYVNIFMTSNPFTNFLVGTAEGLAGNNVDFYQCFPDEWKTQVKADSLKTNGLDNSFQGWGEGLKLFITASGTVIEFFCNFRETVMKFISGVVLLYVKVLSKRKRKFRSSFLELNSATDRSISSFKRNYMARKLQSISSAKVEGIWDDIKNWAFKNWIDPIRNKISQFILKIKQFFESETVQMIIKFIKCAMSAGSAISEIYSTFQGFYDKFKILMAALPNPITLILVIVDYVTALICNWKKFKTGINYFINAWNNNNVNLKWLFYGKAVGTFFNAIGTASTFSELYKSIQNDLQNPKKK